jgi:hypothetical protein
MLVKPCPHPFSFQSRRFFEQADRTQLRSIDALDNVYLSRISLDGGIDTPLWRKCDPHIARARIDGTGAEVLDLPHVFQLKVLAPKQRQPLWRKR